MRSTHSRFVAYFLLGPCALLAIANSPIGSEYAFRGADASQGRRYLEQIAGGQARYGPCRGKSEVLAMKELEALARRVAPGVVAAGGLRDDERWLWPAEEQDQARRFHLGSVTKLFTALLLAEMAQRGEVALEDPVAKFLAAASGLGDLSLLELATHSSGLPQLPDPLPRRGSLRPHDPYSMIRSCDMEEALTGVDELVGRGSFQYSNFGYAVLGLALAAAGRGSFQALLRARVLDPLELKGTASDSDAGHDVETGHDLSGNRVPPWHNPTMAGCGSLVSSVPDLLKFLAAQLRPETSPLAAAIRATQERRVLRPLKPERCVGRGGMIDYANEDATYWHNGATYGFSAYVGFRPRTNAALALLVSQRPTGDGTLERLGEALLDAQWT